MRILVTGAGGYIGRHLVPRLRAEGHEVIAMHRWPSDAPAHPDDKCGIDWSAHGVADLVHRNYLPPDTVIHLAGRVDISFLPNPKGVHLPPIPGHCDIGALYRDNVLATANVLDYCLKAGVKHLIFASTLAVYGDHRYDREDTPEIEPLEHYAASKRAAEQLLEVGSRRGLPITILRLPGIYGGDRKSGAVYQMCRDALEHRSVKVTTGYELYLHALHIEDVTSAFLQVINYPPRNEDGDLYGPSHSINVHDDSTCSLDILAAEIAKLTNSQVQSGPVKQPDCSFPDYWRYGDSLKKWCPKPRKERLAQVLEEIRCDRNA